MTTSPRGLLCAILIAAVLTFYALALNVAPNKRIVGARRTIALAMTSSDASNNKDISNNSLITLLNFAQEVGNSQNQRLRQSADRLRAQFVASFSQKYDLAKEQLATLAGSLANIDDDTALSMQGQMLRADILEQLNCIESRALNVIFFNEPLTSLDEYRYNPGVPVDMLDHSAFEVPPLSTLAALEAAAPVITDEKAIADVLRRAKFQRESKNPLLLQKQEVDTKKLKKALRAETMKFFVEPGVPGRGGSGGTQQDRGDREETEEKEKAKMDDVQRQQQQERIQKHSNKATYARWREAMEDIEKAGAIAPPSAGSKASPNYAALIQACLLACMATYNLKLSSYTLEMLIDGDDIKEVKQRIQQVVGAVSPDPLTGEFTYASAANLVDSALAAANSAIEPTQQEVDQQMTQLQRASKLSSMALGLSPSAGAGTTSSFSMQVVQSLKACALVGHDKNKGVAVVAFRGTKDPVDIITDITFLSSAFEPQSRPATWVPWADKQDGAVSWKDMTMEVHSGFLSAFESLRPQLQEKLDALPPGTKVLFVGHSMGGALAQLAAAYFSDRKPFLVHFGSPAVGNGAFCKFLTDFVHPFGGIRLWNEYDPVPYLALVVGYDHAGIPVKGTISQEAKELFQSESINAITGTIDVALPHILYQIGSVVYVFPMIGEDIAKAETEMLAGAGAKTLVEKEGGMGLREEAAASLRVASTFSDSPLRVTPAPSPSPWTTNNDTQMPEKQSALELIRRKMEKRERRSGAESTHSSGREPITSLIDTSELRALLTPTQPNQEKPSEGDVVAAPQRKRDRLRGIVSSFVARVGRALADEEEEED